MGKKIQYGQMIVLSILVIAIIGMGALLLTKKQGQAIYTTNPRESSYPRYILSIKNGKSWGALKEPSQVLTYKGRLYISDSGNSRVLVFDLKGKFLFELEGSLQKDSRKLRYPYGLAADGGGHVYVADPAIGKVLIFNYLGNYVGTFAQNSKIVKPAGIFFQNNRFYISDIILNKVLVFDKRGKYLFSIGSGNPGNSSGDLYYPNAVAVDENGKIFVSDSMNNRVQIFDKTGRYIETLSGVEETKLSNPRGIALDSNDNIYVAATMGNSIKVYDKNGMFLFDMTKDKKYSLTLPVGISIDPYNNIYVTDVSDNKVLVFKK